MSLEQPTRRQELETIDFKLERLADKDAIRIKNEKIPQENLSRMVYTFYGTNALRRQNKHGYFSARA